MLRHHAVSHHASKFCATPAAPAPPLRRLYAAPADAGLCAASTPPLPTLVGPQAYLPRCAPCHGSKTETLVESRGYAYGDRAWSRDDVVT